MAEHVCPWWLGYWLASPVRGWLQKPEEILAPHVRQGMTVLEPGPGMGFFTLPLARIVGSSGRIIAVDLQSKMLDGLRRRAARAGLADRIETRLAQLDSLGIDDLQGSVDFVLAFAMVHETRSATGFFQQTAATLKPAGRMLFVEPAGHVKPALFENELEAARLAELEVLGRPEIRHSLAALLAIHKP